MSADALPVGPLLVKRKHARAHAALADYTGHLVRIDAQGKVTHHGAACHACQSGRR